MSIQLKIKKSIQMASEVLKMEGLTKNDFSFDLVCYHIGKGVICFWPGDMMPHDAYREHFYFEYNYIFPDEVVGMVGRLSFNEMA